MPTPRSDDFYSASQRRLQQEGQTQKLAEAVVHAIVRDALEEPHIGFIESRDYFFLSTVNDRGEPTVSHKGGPVGFVRAMGPNRLIFPSYDGNGMWLSMGNIADTAKIGMLFIDMETPNRIRVQGDARLTTEAGLMALFPGANMVVDVQVTAVFMNCARYIHPHKRVGLSRYVPDAEGTQPFPAWKRIDALQGSLHPADEGRAAAEGGTITEGEYIQRLMAGVS